MSIIDKAKKLFVESDIAFKRGDYKIKEKMAAIREKWQELLASEDDRGTIIEWFGLSIINNGRDIGMLALLFEGFSLEKYTRLIKSWLAVANAVGKKPKRFSRAEAKAMLAEYEKSHPDNEVANEPDTPIENDDPLAFIDALTRVQSADHARRTRVERIDFNLRNWAFKQGWWGDRPDNRADAVDMAIAEAQAKEAEAVIEIDRKAEIEAAINEAEKVKLRAIADENYVLAGEKKDELDELRKELAELDKAKGDDLNLADLDAALEAEAPAPIEEASNDDVPGFDEAEAACLAADATDELKNLYGRFNANGFDEKIFVEAVSYIKNGPPALRRAAARLASGELNAATFVEKVAAIKVALG